jgi:chaperonin GroES
LTEIQGEVMNIRPLQDRVVLKRWEAEKTTAGGIVIPDTAKEKPTQAEVVAVGPGKSLDNGEIRPMSVKPGDKVLVGKYAGTELKLDGVEYVVLREDEIFGIIEG